MARVQPGAIVQNPRCRQLARSRLRQWTEHERARDERDGRGKGTRADPSRRVDDVPAAAEGRVQRGADALGDRPGMPGDKRRRTVVDRLDEHPPGGRNDDRLTEVDEIVVRVAGTGEPDAAVEHLEPAAGRAEGEDATWAQGADVVARCPDGATVVARDQGKGR